MQNRYTIILIILFMLLGLIGKSYATEKNTNMHVSATIYYPPHFSINGDRFNCDCQYVKPVVKIEGNIISIEY